MVFDIALHSPSQPWQSTLAPVPSGMQCTADADGADAVRMQSVMGVHRFLSNHLRIARLPVHDAVPIPAHADVAASPVTSYGCFNRCSLLTNSKRRHYVGLSSAYKVSPDILARSKPYTESLYPI